MKPSKNRKLELIDKKISQFQKILAEVTYDKLHYEAYKSAYLGTELLLTELFPKEEPNNFHNHVGFTAFIEGKIFFYEGGWELQEYKDNINSCIAYLEAYRNRIQNFWGTDELETAAKSTVVPLISMNDKAPIIIDGANFINRILDMEIDKGLISKQLILRGLREILNEKLRDLKTIKVKCEKIEFVCSKKSFGPSSNKFTRNERNILLSRIMEEIGVYVKEVDIPGKSEKGVDIMISTRIETYLENSNFLVLVSADRDYIPVLNKMREKQKKIIVVSLQSNYPREIANEAYARIDIKDNYECLFEYSYPRFFIHDFTIENCREMISDADDRKTNQIRVDDHGSVYISHENVGSANLVGVKYRFETFAPFHGYVGPKAASDQRFVNRQFKQIKSAWELNAIGYIDYPVESVWGKKKK